MCNLKNPDHNTILLHNYAKKIDELQKEITCLYDTLGYKFVETLISEKEELKKIVQKLEEENEILKKELKVIFNSHGKSYYDMDRIKLLVKIK